MRPDFLIMLHHFMKKAFPNVYISHFAALGVFFCEESVQLTAATVTRRKGQ